MANKFSKIAQDATLLSPIMSGRQKLDTEEVINKPLTIIGFDFAPKFDQAGDPVIDESTGEVDQFGVIIFEEFPGKYYCVGSIFSKVCKAWAAGYDSPEEASTDLAKEGGVKVRFSPTKTKKGNNLIAVEIIG